MENLAQRGILELQQMMDQGAVSSVQLTQYYLNRIKQYDVGDKGLNAVREVNPAALQEAASLDDERRSNGPRSKLHGIPILVKDNYATKGMSTTAGSILFAGHQPPYDAHAVARLKQAGAIILGKVNMHEFAYGITTVGSVFGATKNPYNPGRNPGGSSGGTGAAIAADFAVFGMGSDTCGSIRIPAAHNNLVGLRGTQGLSSRFGIIPLSHTQDIGGPLARSITDLALALDVTVGVDVKDPQTQAAAGHYSGSFFDELAAVPGLRVGVLKDWLVQDEADQAVALVFEDALDVMARKQNWQITPISSPVLNQSLQRDFDGHYVLIADFATDINDYLSAHPDIGLKNLTELLETGKLHAQIVPSVRASLSLQDADESAYLAEIAQRQVVAEAVQGLLEQHNLDVLAYPTIRQVAAELGEPQGGTNCRIAANSGLPAITVPAGFTGSGMPVGLELLADRWKEQLLLDAGYTVEQTYPQRRAPRLP